MRYPSGTSANYALRQASKQLCQGEARGSTNTPPRRQSGPGSRTLPTTTWATRRAAWRSHCQDIDHSRTKTKSPQNNDIFERFHKTVRNEFYRVAFRKKMYRSIDELKVDLDSWIKDYNEARPRQDAGASGKPRCRLSSMQCRWQRRNDRGIRSDAKTRPLNQAPAVRSSSS